MLNFIISLSLLAIALYTHMGQQTCSRRFVTFQLPTEADVGYTWSSSEYDRSPHTPSPDDE